MSANRKIQVTSNYRLFGRSEDNRELDIKKHARLIASMKKYGFLSCFPIACIRDAKGNLVVKEGQHRLAIAEMLGLPVYWVEAESDFDVAEINCTPKTWTMKDYASKYAKSGIAEYQEAIDFANLHDLPIATAYALLAGTTSFGNVRNAFLDGTYAITDRAWANSVVAVYGPLTKLSSVVKNNRLLLACMAICRVSDLNTKRLIINAERCRDKLVAYSTREAYLDMLETVYNFGQKRLVGLKAAAITAMRERNPSPKNSDGDE